MSKVYIGKKYASAFKSICELYRNGYVSKGIVESIDPSGREIVYRGTTFVLDRSDGASEDRTYTMDQDGASWFRAVREHSAIDSSASDWLGLISDVAEDYHKHNSFLVFKQKARSVDPAKVEEQKKIVERFFRAFYPALGVPRVIFVPEDRTAEIDIFALNFMMDINNGVGESKKILGKVYFKYVNRHFYLLDQAEGSEIEKQVNGIVETDDFENSEIDSDASKNSKIIEDVLAKLESEIKLPDFSRAVIFTGEEDRKIIDDYVASGPQMNVELDCLHLRVIGIYHIKWSNLSYRIEYNSAPLLNVRVTTNNRMTVSCARCKDEDDSVLMVDDVIEYYEEEGKKKTLRIDVEKDDFGLDEETMEMLREKSNFGRHLIPLACQNVDFSSRKGSSCRRTVCARDSFEAEDGQRYCRDCEYPAKICEDFNHEPRITETLGYASDVRAFVVRDELNRCEICGRRFLRPFSAGSDLCPLCEKVGSEQLSEDENVFKGYRDLFPLGLRLFTRRKKSAAVQDAEVIVFRVRIFGRDRYYISDKLDLQKKGYLSGPKRIRESEGRTK